VARHRGFPARSRSRRITAWGLGPADADGALSASGAALWSQGIVITVNEVTLVRIRGNLRIIIKSSSAAGDGYRGASGIGIVTKEAFAAGAVSMPTPQSNADWDGWLWHSFWTVQAITATIADGVNAAAVSKDIEIDSKAMRKWNDDMTLFGMHEVVELGTSTIEFQADSRLLVKLS